MVASLTSDIPRKPRWPGLAAGVALWVLLGTPALAGTHAGTASGTWLLQDSPHLLLDDVNVPAGQTLVIEAGCHVLAIPGAALSVDGALNVRGTPSNPVRFGADDWRPFAGAWRGLDLRGAGPHDLAWASISHAETGIAVRGGAELHLTGSSVAWSSGHGLSFESGSLGNVTSSFFGYNGRAGVAIENSSPAVITCDFLGNEDAMVLGQDSFPVLRNLFATRNSRWNAVFVDAAWPVTTSGSWHDAGLPYVIGDGATLTVAPDTNLHLSAGAVVKLGSGARFAISGQLTSSSTLDQPAIVTTIADDAALGDTNGDGALTAPLKGAWDGIDVRTSGSVDLSHVRISFGSDGVRVWNGALLRLNACEVGDSTGRGVSFGPGASGSLEGCFVHDNATGVQVVDPVAVSLGRDLNDPVPAGSNVFRCNDVVDVDNLSGTLLPALRNFWSTTAPGAGSVSGPVDTGSHLVLPPDENAVRRPLVLERAGLSDLRVTWPRGASCVRVVLESDSRPNGSFASVAAAYTNQGALVAGAAIPDGEAVRYYRLRQEL